MTYEITKKLNFINKQIPPIFEIGFKDNDVIVYAKKKMNILKKDGSPNFELKRLENIEIKSKNDFLNGMILLGNLWMQFQKLREKNEKIRE